MPAHERPDGKPVVEFDPAIELSPFIVFRRLRDGRELLLVDVRRAPSGRTLTGAQRFEGDAWTPPPELDVMLFDEDGSEAVPIVRRLQAAGFSKVRALFGGLELYEFALDPEVVGQQTYLERSGDIE